MMMIPFLAILATDFAKEAQNCSMVDLFPAPKTAIPDCRFVGLPLLGQYQSLSLLLVDLVLAKQVLAFDLCLQYLHWLACSKDSQLFVENLSKPTEWDLVLCTQSTSDSCASCRTNVQEPNFLHP